jgi:hypothetical protein
MMKTSEPRIRRLLVVGGIGAAATALTNAVIFGVGRAAGVEYVITTTSKGAQSVHLADVSSLSLISFAIGVAAAVVATWWKRPSLRALQVVGGIVAVVSTYGDFTIDGRAAATALLASMHIVAGAVYIASLQIVRSSTSTRSAVASPTAHAGLETLAA